MKAVCGMDAEIGGLFAIDWDRDRPDVPDAVDGAMEERTGEGSCEDATEERE